MAQRICSIEDCESRVYGHGWCSKHWQRWRKYGDPLAYFGPANRYGPRRTHVEDALADRFTVQDDGCWLWTGTTDTDGYGHFTWKDKQRMAHRWVWFVAVGPIPDALQLDHLRRTPGCVNPDHLEPVTPEENRRRTVRLRGKETVNGQKSHCPRGHAYDSVNTRIDNMGRRRCRTCENEKARAKYHRLKATVS